MILIQPLFALGITSGIAEFIVYLSKILGGYGWAFIALGVLTRLLIAPFYHMQMQQMKKMQKIKPYLDALQKKYADNQEELTRKTMELFQQHKVNPFSGCLLAILQIPFLIAIYRAIYANLEMFKGKTFLWIKDLSQPDLILFALYVLSMYLSMEMTPTEGVSEEEMARMKRFNLIFILFFAVLLYKFASAFILYWFSFNVVGMIHTWILHNFSFKEEDFEVKTKGIGVKVEP